MGESWFASAVLYQVNLRGLAAREPRNAIEGAREWKRGTRNAERGAADRASPLAYLQRNLATIADLGANVLYLMPVYPIGLEARKGIGSPYAIRDFTDVDPEFGTREELGALIRAAHAADLRVILDITPNHTSRDNVWTRAHPDYYVKNAQGGLFHDWDWSDTAKLDYGNPALRAAMREVYRFWLGFAGGVDGFRLDMAHIVSDRGFWDETVPTLRAERPDRPLLWLAECYGAANNKDLFGRGINAAYDDDFYKFAQYFYAVTEDGRTAVAPSPDAAHNADFAGAFAAFGRGGLAGAMAHILGAYDDAAAAAGGGPWLARYTDNHDEGRGLYRFGPGAVRALNAVAFLAPRSLPMLLTGQEFGALNRPPIHARFGLCDKGFRVVRDGQVLRTEPGIELEGNVFARTAGERADWYAFYRELIRLRRSQPALNAGTCVWLDAGEEAPPEERAVLAFARRAGARALHCAVNLGPRPRRLRRAVEMFAGTPLYGGLSGGTLPPFAAVVTPVPAPR